MFKPLAEVMSELTALNATYRFGFRGEQYEPDKDGDPKKTRQIAPGYTYCEIKDLTTGEIYAQARGGSEGEALSKAVEAARTAPKPLTTAQKADGTIAAQAQRIKELEAQLAGRSVEPEPEAKRGRGRFRKPVTVPPEENDNVNNE